MTHHSSSTCHGKKLWVAPLAVCRRKNLGYLWAIQHGATQVYETDDDNELKLDEPPALSGLNYYVYDASGATTGHTTP